MSFSNFECCGEHSQLLRGKCLPPPPPPPHPLRKRRLLSWRSIHVYIPEQSKIITSSWRNFENSIQKFESFSCLGFQSSWTGDFFFQRSELSSRLKRCEHSKFFVIQVSPSIFFHLSSFRSELWKFAKHIGQKAMVIIYIGITWQCIKEILHINWILN